MPSSKKSRILIVDDVPANLHMLMELLMNDYDIVPAKDGETALKKAFKPPHPDLILLDILMPGLDGYDVCRRLKAEETTSLIPVIFITAISEFMDEAKAFDVGGVDYITKPFNPSTVMARVKTHIQLSRTAEELRNALKEIKVLSGLLPICASCKKVRDDQGYWQQIEQYIQERSKAQFTHSICPQCMKKLYPELFKKKIEGALPPSFKDE